MCSRLLSRKKKRELLFFVMVAKTSSVFFRTRHFFQVDARSKARVEELWALLDLACIHLNAEHGANLTPVRSLRTMKCLVPLPRKTITQHALGFKKRPIANGQQNKVSSPMYAHESERRSSMQPWCRILHVPAPRRTQRRPLARLATIPAIRSGWHRSRRSRARAIWRLSACALK